MDTTNDTGPSRSTPREELRNAADHLYQAADDAVEVVMPRRLRHHLRDAARHLFAAGVAAIDEMERRGRLREERKQRRAERDQPAAAQGDIAGSHTPGCL